MIYLLRTILERQLLMESRLSTLRILIGDDSEAKEKMASLVETAATLSVTTAEGFEHAFDRLYTDFVVSFNREA